MHETIPQDVSIAPFCPLPDYPSGVIAQMEATIRTLRGLGKPPFFIEIFSLLAKRLGVLLHTNSGGLTIELEDDTKVHLLYDTIHNVEVSHTTWSIFFHHEGTLYRLSLYDKPSLSRKVQIPGVENMLWQECELKKN